MLAGGSRKRGGERGGGEEGAKKAEGRVVKEGEREREIREGFSWVSRAERVPLPSFLLSRRMNSNRSSQRRSHEAPLLLSSERKETFTQIRVNNDKNDEALTRRLVEERLPSRKKMEEREREEGRLCGSDVSFNSIFPPPRRRSRLDKSLGCITVHSHGRQRTRYFARSRKRYYD